MVLSVALFMTVVVTPAAWALTPAGTVISNVASADFTIGPSSPIVTRSSNTVSVTTVAFRTPGVVRLFQYVQSSPTMTVSPTAYSNDGTPTGTFVAMAAPVVPLGGSSTTLNLANPVPLMPAALYHAGEPAFIQLTDLDQNLNPAALETVLVTVRDDITGDTELVRLQETGPNTGVFAGYIQTTSQPAVSSNGLLSVAPGSHITASYTDVMDGSDRSAMNVTTDPLSKVLSSATGLPVNGASITLIDNTTNLPATVYGDDGVSIFPSTIVSGATTTDSSGKSYAFGPGEFRFPFIQTGTYHFQIAPPSGFKAPSTVAASAIQALPGGPFAIVDPASRGGLFSVSIGAVVQIDVPLDPLGNRLYLVKTVNKNTVAVGDFLQYKLSVQNLDPANPVDATIVTDAMPLGFRYRNGSTKRGGHAAPDPAISGDGRLLLFTVGTVPAGGTIDITYVSEVAVGAVLGMNINTAIASGSGNARSNPAMASVIVTQEFFNQKAFIVGRVVPDGCGRAEAAEENGVEGVRLFMEDGTYVVTDKNGMFHFEGVNPGTHVVQVDLDTIPEKYELLACEQNSRFAGTAYSQFVDLQGGTLWRADFHLGLKPNRTGDVSLELRSVLTAGGNGDSRIVEYTVPVHTATVSLHNLRLTIMLPDSAVYQPGSSLLNAAHQEDPTDMQGVITYNLGDVPADWEGTVRLNATVPLKGSGNELATKALLTFDTPRKKNERSPVVDNLLLREIRETRSAVPDIVLHPKFTTLSAALSKKDREALDKVVQDLEALKVEHITVVGHTDSNKIVGSGLKKFADNYALSMARARAVGTYIAGALNLPLDRVTFIGKGADKPVASNETEAGRGENRRVELSVTAEAVASSVELRNERDQSGIKKVSTTGLRPGERWAPSGRPNEGKNSMPDYTAASLDNMPESLGWLWPADGYHPSIPAMSFLVRHNPARKTTIILNGEEVDGFYLDNTIKRADYRVAVTLWRGVHLKDGDNLFQVIEYDENDVETARVTKTFHYSGPPVKAELVQARSKLSADGKTPPVLAMRLTDKEGHPAREGVLGEYSVDSPYLPLQRIEDLQKNALSASTSERLKFQVGADGIVQIELQPTTRSGEAVVRLNLLDGIQEVKAWLTPDKRDWVLVGLAEGTLGYNTASRNMESLAAAGVEEDYYHDGRLAFYAKGTIKGEWLLTIAYDTEKNNGRNPQSLYGTIDPNKYYTLYGDATNQRYDAASSRSLYVKIERDQFYALFGDYDTGLTMTELSRYTRQFTGLKSELKSQNFDYTVYASQNDQVYVKDEIQGDGTSGLYLLSKNNIIINSETVVIETRDRFRSEVILSSQQLTRYLDYSIDYASGTIWFKSPVFSRDENFNPIFIVVKYELFDTKGGSWNYGGRGAVHTRDQNAEVGVSRIHEEEFGGSADLTGTDATIKLDDKTKIRAELAHSRNDESGTEQNGTAYLIEASHKSERFEGTAYVREQDIGFGLGQQNQSETGTRKIGYDFLYKFTDSLGIAGSTFRQENLENGAVRDMAELQGKYSQKTYELFSGVRYARDTFTDGQVGQSDQFFVGARDRLTDRLSVLIRRDQSIGNDNNNADYPTRTTLGADYKLNETATLFGAQEFTHGGQSDTSMTRVGLRASPWTGGQMSESLQHEATDNGERLFSVLGLKQSWQLTQQWTVDFGLDRSQTISKTTGSTGSNPALPVFNPNVPPASGGPDFTALSVAVGYRAEKWSWAARVEERFADTETKFNVFSGFLGEPREGIGLAAAVQASQSISATNGRSRNDDFRLGFVYRPKQTRWIVLDRLDLLIDQRRDSSTNYEDARVVNNLNTNYRALPDLQVALQYSCKYVRETIDEFDYRGYTDLIGLEGIYDLTKRWDISLKGSMLHSWSVDQYQYGSSASVGYNFVKNMLIRAGYNFTGFTDRDFSKADFTARGPFIKFSMKFDQMSVREVVKWISGQ
jgi:uncharacterized repeat protein (TIGR01451 family)